jgi:hypothetical protein
MLDTLDRARVKRDAALADLLNASDRYNALNAPFIVASALAAAPDAHWLRLSDSDQTPGYWPLSAVTLDGTELADLEDYDTDDGALNSACSDLRHQHPDVIQIAGLREQRATFRCDALLALTDEARASIATWCAR